MKAVAKHVKLVSHFTDGTGNGIEKNKEKTYERQVRCSRAAYPFSIDNKNLVSRDQKQRKKHEYFDFFRKKAQIRR